MRRLMLFLAIVIMAGCAASNPMYDAAADKAMQAATHDEAVKIFETGTKGHMHTDRYYAGLADIHFRYGYFGEAVNDYTRAIRSYDKAQYHLQRGRSYMKLHFYRDAEIDFSSVIDSQGSRMPVAYVEKAKANVARGNFSDAMKDLEKAENKNGGSIDFLVAMGDLSFRMGRLEQAKTYIQKALEKDAGNSDLYLLRAKVFYRSKDANQAISDLKKALTLDATNYDAKRMLAWIYATNPISEYRNGKEALRLSEELYSVAEEAQYAEVLAAAYAETGDFKKAVEVLKEGILGSADAVQKEDFRFDIQNYEKEQPVRTW